MKTSSAHKDPIKPPTGSAIPRKLRGTVLTVLVNRSQSHRRVTERHLDFTLQSQPHEKRKPGKLPCNRCPIGTNKPRPLLLSQQPSSPRYKARYSKSSTALRCQQSYWTGRGRKEPESYTYNPTPTAHTEAHSLRRRQPYEAYIYQGARLSLALSTPRSPLGHRPQLRPSFRPSSYRSGTLLKV